MGRPQDEGPEGALRQGLLLLARRKALLKLAIVGSTCLKGNDYAHARVLTIITSAMREVAEGEELEIVSGGAEGVDSMAAEIAQVFNLPLKVFLPAQPSWYWYKKRNQQIADYCDRLVRIVGSCSKTYGSGWTRDRAREQGKPTEEYVITA